ncbi:alpha/beta hydrolase [Mycobacterium sp.]|uniref:alpha/beta hydrolase n=1 Tax=Mycobacterium sp. TaxID=1785 RepID=UPI003BB6FC60
MTLTVADIDRWSAESVREVFHATNARGQATLEASRQLSTLAVFDTWEGATAEARKHANASIRQDLDAHGNESLAVAQAAGKAADDIERVQSDLRTLRHDATELDMTIDPLSNKVVPTPNCLPTEALIAEMQLQPRLNAIIAEANAVDTELAAAINMADGDTPIPAGPHENRPDIQQALSKPLPTDPKQFADLWNQLTPEEKDWLYSQDHDVGNHDGMPWDPSDHLGKDHYNRLHLPELEQQTQADVDRMQQSLDELMREPNADDGAIYSLQSQLAAARTHLRGYQDVEATLNKSGPHRYLGQLDQWGHGAIAINNPDTAKRNAILVPGTGQDLTTMDGADNKSLAMYGAALDADHSLKPDDVSVTTWMGYDRPMDLGQADFPDPARASAANLDGFEAGQRASHVGAPSIDTVIGHSYGSTMVGAAASDGHHLDADNIISVGSPGMLVDHAGDLSLDPGGHIYAMRAENDIIGAAGGVTQFSLGPEPDKPDFGAIRLQAAPGPSWPLGLPSIDAHSSYWSPENPALANMGSIIAGKPPPFVAGQR